MIRTFRALSTRASFTHVRSYAHLLVALALAAISSLAFQPKAQAYGSCVTSNDCYWRAAQDNIANVVTGKDGSIWALSSVTSPYGQQVKKGRWYSTGNGEYGYWIFDNDGGARGTSISTSMDDGNPWVVAYDSSVWYRLNGSWYALPRTQCEGGQMTAQQTLGHNSIAAAESNMTYVIESADTPNPSVRYFQWFPYCWAKLPAPPSTPVSIDVWFGETPKNRRLPWISAADNNAYLWDGEAWQKVARTRAKGVGRGVVIGQDGVSLWFQQPNTTALVKDTAWTAGKVLQISDGDWAVDANHRAYHWEN